jgi:hypothetical protein
MKTALSFIAASLFTLSAFGQYQFDKNLQSVTPSSGPVAGGTTVTITGDIHFGGVVVNPCGVPQVYVGGLQAQVTNDDATSITFVTPAYVAGTFDVLVDRCGNRGAVKNAFSYLSGGRSWESVLLPVYLQNDLRGAFGSVWRTSLTAFNLGDNIVFRGLSDRTGQQLSYGQFNPSVDSDQHQPGRIVSLSPAFGAKRIRLNVHVRDLSREASTLGTELGPIYEDDAFGPFATFALVNVPLGDPYRQKLRVYRMDVGQPAIVNMVFYDAAGKDIGFLSITSSTEPQVGDFQIYPGYLEVDLDRLDFLAGQATTTIEIVAPSGRWWGYVSVTNNITQQITNITP